MLRGVLPFYRSSLLGSAVWASSQIASRWHPSEECAPRPGGHSCKCPLFEKFPDVGEAPPHAQLSSWHPALEDQAALEVSPLRVPFEDERPACTVQRTRATRALN